MNARTARRSLALTLAGLFIVGGLAAAPLVGMGSMPVAVKPVLSVPADPGLDATSALALVRDQVYTAAKELGASPEVLAPALARIAEQGALHQVDMASIHDVTSTIPDYDMAMKLEAYLLGFAETAALGTVVDGTLPSVGLDSASATIKKDRLGAIDREPGGGISPRNLGICKLCTDGTIPEPGFGPFTPTPAWQFHSESTDAANDCNWYVFNVVNGVQYQFTTCSPGAATWDTVLEIYTNPACSFVILQDDAFCAPTNAASDLTWTSNVTGTIKLKVRGFGAAFGAYTLAYRQVACSACLSPISTLNPTAACQIVSGTVNSTCPSLFYNVNLVAGSNYRFTTCPGDCAATSCTTISDTVLELYPPTALTCVIGERVAFSDDIGVMACPGFGARSRIDYTATVTGAYKIKARAISVGTSGTICMGYLQTAGGGCTNNCSTGPFVATITPTPVCQTHTASVVAPCQDTWYNVNVTAAGLHEFTTCSAPVCGGGNAAFDSIIELYNSTCTLLASDNDGCGAPRSNLTFNIPSPGLYKLRMRSASGTPGLYTMTYRSVGILCTAPSNVTITPTSGTASTGTNTCRITQTFNVTAAGSSTMNYVYTITPPAGGSAAPSTAPFTGAVAPTNPGSFTSTLTREGIFGVSVTGTNSCGNSTTAIMYTLRDLTPPTFATFPANTTVQCTAVPPVPVLNAVDNCDPNPVETFSSVTTPGSCPGRYTITRTWTARDRAGNVSAPRSQTINVVDTVPPVIVPDTSVKYCIYPPNHELVCFLKSQFSPVITDNCSNPITWKFVGVLSSEQGFIPCGDGNIDPDTIVAPAGDGFCVRSERCGQDPSENDGRVYLLVATATDACGNTSQPTAVGAILVPHDQSDTSACIEP